MRDLKIGQVLSLRIRIAYFGVFKERLLKLLITRIRLYLIAYLRKRLLIQIASFN